MGPGVYAPSWFCSLGVPPCILLASFPFLAAEREPDPSTAVKAAQAFQYLATILATVVVVLVMVAACMATPITGKLGLAAGVMLAMVSLFELITFSVMAVAIKECESKYLSFA